MFSNMALASFIVFSIPSRSQEVEGACSVDGVVKGGCSVEGVAEEGGCSVEGVAEEEGCSAEGVAKEGGCLVEGVAEEGGGGGLFLAIPAPLIIRFCHARRRPPSAHNFNYFSLIVLLYNFFLFSIIIFWPDLRALYLYTRCPRLRDRK